MNIAPTTAAILKEKTLPRAERRRSPRPPARTWQCYVLSPPTYRPMARLLGKSESRSAVWNFLVGWYWNCSESISGRAENAREIERLAAQKELPPGSQLFAV
jgi:hypothetical protein